MPAFGFMGPGYQTRGLSADSQAWLNCCLEKTESGSSPSGQPYTAILTPGKNLLVTLSDSPVSAVTQSNSRFYTSSTNLYFAIAGSTLFAITASYVAPNWVGTATVIGSVGPGAIIGGTGGQNFPSQIIVINPNLLFCLQAGLAYVAGYGSAIVTTNLSAGGGGGAYAVGDTGIVTGGLIPAQYVVNSVDPSTGAVLTYTITYAGTGYTAPTLMAGTMAGLTQPGNGVGFTIDITAVAAPAWLLQQQTIPQYGVGNFIATATWMDGYVIVSMASNAADPQRRQFYMSNLNDPTTWSPLNFDTKEANSDPVIRVFAAYEILIIFGSQTIELWQDTGNVLSAFQRLPGGGVIQNGLAQPYCVDKMDGSVVWLGSDERGQYVAWSLQGTTPTRISNHAIENTWSQYDSAGACSYSYQENGHFYWVLHFPIPDKTWVYDSTLGPAIGWHQRAWWDGTQFHADRGRYHGFFPEVGHCVGDPSNGNLYIQGQQFLTDNCLGIIRQRTSPQIVNGLMWTYFDHYRFHGLQGVVPSTGAGSAPVCTIELSNDGGHSFGSPQTAPLGTTGEYDWVTEWRRQGRARNRVVRWTMNQPIDMVIVDLYAEAAAGSG